MRELTKILAFILLAYAALYGVRSCMKSEPVEVTRPPGPSASSYSRPQYNPPIVIDPDSYKEDKDAVRHPIIAKLKRMLPKVEKKALPAKKKPAKKRHVVQESKKAVKKASPPPQALKVEPKTGCHPAIPCGPKVSPEQKPKGFLRRQWDKVPAVPKDDGRSYDKCHKNNFSRFCIKELR